MLKLILPCKTPILTQIIFLLKVETFFTYSLPYDRITTNLFHQRISHHYNPKGSFLVFNKPISTMLSTIWKQLSPNFLNFAITPPPPTLYLPQPIPTSILSSIRSGLSVLIADLRPFFFGCFIVTAICWLAQYIIDPYPFLTDDNFPIPLIHQYNEGEHSDDTTHPSRPARPSEEALKHRFDPNQDDFKSDRSDVKQKQQQQQQQQQQPIHLDQLNIPKIPPDTQDKNFEPRGGPANQDELSLIHRLYGQIGHRMDYFLHTYCPSYSTAVKNTLVGTFTIFFMSVILFSLLSIFQLITLHFSTILIICSYIAAIAFSGHSLGYLTDTRITDWP